MKKIIDIYKKVIVFFQDDFNGLMLCYLIYFIVCYWWLFIPKKEGW